MGSLIGIENAVAEAAADDDAEFPAVVAFPPLWIAGGAQIRRRHKPDANFAVKLQAKMKIRTERQIEKESQRKKKKEREEGGKKKGKKEREIVIFRHTERQTDRQTERKKERKKSRRQKSFKKV